MSEKQGGPIVLGVVNRVVVFVHPGQLKNGCIHLVGFCDAQQELFTEGVQRMKDSGAICLYDGPPNTGNFAPG